MRQFLIALIFMSMFAGCSKQEVFITVELPDQPDVHLVYTIPISGTNFIYFMDTLKVSETGKYELTLKLKQPSFIFMWNENNFENTFKLLLEPGNNYYVSMDSKNNVQIRGANEKGHMLYTTLPNPAETVEMELRNKNIRPYNDTISFTYVHHKITELKQSDISEFRTLLDGGEISKSYFDLIQKDRDFYYASLEARFYIIKTYPYLAVGTKIENDLLENLKKIYDQYPPDDENLLFSSFWYEYAKDYVQGYQQYIQKDFDFQKIQNFRKDGTQNTYYFNEAKKYLSGRALEYYQASLIQFETVGFRNMEKEFISLFEQFEKEYPKSEYTKYLKPHIDKIIRFYQIIEQPFASDMLFMDNYENVNTLEEAIKPFQGKKIYIDVWATWCGPCLEEFAHNEALKNILAENNIQQLYISIDRDSNDQNWKNYIKFYHLTGTHIRANTELHRNLAILYDAERPGMYIPWYILIDENGNIMEEHAKNPSQLVSGEKLW